MQFSLKNKSRLLFLTLSTLFALTVSAGNAIAAAPPRGIFIEPTFGYMNLDMPNFTYGSYSTGQAGSAVDFNTSTANIVPGVCVGVNFNSNFLAPVFGTTATIEASFEHVSAHTTSSAASLPANFYWNINGSGLIVPFVSIVPMNERTMYAEGVNFRANNEMDFVNLKYMGHKDLGNYGGQNLMNEPFVAVFYRYLKQDDSLTTTSFNTPFNGSGVPRIPFPLSLNENVKANYYGVQLGDRWLTQWNPQIDTYLEGTVAVARVHAVLNGSEMLQLPNNYLPQTSVNGAVNNSENSWDYEAGLAAGVEWTPPTTFPIKFTVSGGANWISTVPEIVNPVNVGEIAHLTNTSAINPYVEARVSFTLPF